MNIQPSENHYRKLPPINSLSSGLMLFYTSWRNGPGGKILSQVAYAEISLVAIIESIVASIFCIGSLVLRPSSFQKSVNWLSSSSFCIVWSMTDFILNPFVSKLVADEQSARQIALRGNLLRIPTGAIIW